VSAEAGIPGTGAYQPNGELPVGGGLPALPEGTAEAVASVPIADQPLYPDTRARNQRPGLRRAASGALALSLVSGFTVVDGVVSAGPARADAIANALAAYPDISMSCEHPNSQGAYATTGPCTNYDWGPVHTTALGDPSTISSRGYGYRNCTDWVAWRVDELGGSLSATLGNAKDWPNSFSPNYITSTPAPGDVAVSASGTYGHVAFVEAVNTANSTMTVSEYNEDKEGDGDQRTLSESGSEFTEFINVGVNPLSGDAPTNGPQLIINNTEAWAEDPIGNNWANESAANDAKAVAVGGTNMVMINGCGAVYDKNTLTGSWDSETGCDAATAIAASANGTKMYLGTCGDVNAEADPGGNWTQEIGCGNATQIAVGENGTQMILTGCNSVYAKTSIGVGGWNGEGGCGTASEIAAGSENIQVILNACDAVYAENTIGASWNEEAGCGTANNIAANGLYQMLLNACGEVYAQSNIGTVWTAETNCGAATGIAVGDQGRQLYIGGNGDTYGEDSSTLGDNWTDETPGADGTTAIAVG
jgi:CHAP domain